MCAPVSQTRPDSSEGELADDSNMPSRKHHQSKSPQGEAGRLLSLTIAPLPWEMWSVISGLLHLQVPQVECLVAPPFHRNLLNRLLRSTIYPYLLFSTWVHRFRRL